jgi:hypothetical protein
LLGMLRRLTWNEKGFLLLLNYLMLKAPTVGTTDDILTDTHCADNRRADCFAQAKYCLSQTLSLSFL